MAWSKALSLLRCSSTCSSPKCCYMLWGPWTWACTSATVSTAHHSTFKTKTLERFFTEALFADDCAFMVHQDNHLQTTIDKFSTATTLLGLTICLSKTEVLYQPAQGRAADQPCITIDGTKLSNVTTFKYLGSPISSVGSLDQEINARVQKASQALGRLRSKVLQHKI